MTILGVYHDVSPTWSIGQSSGCDTVVYVTAGKVIYRIENQPLVLEKGEALYIPAAVSRAWTNHSEVGHEKYTVVFSRTGMQGDQFADRRLIVRLKLRNAAYFEQRFGTMFLQWLGQRPYYEDLSAITLSELLVLMAREQMEQKSSPAKERMARKLQDFILNHFRRNVTVQELAGVAGITPNYVTVLFKEVVGTTPIQYLHQTRMNSALHLLEDGQITVREVAEYLGYCDQSHFHRVFKKWMGVAPTRLRS